MAGLATGGRDATRSIRFIKNFLPISPVTAYAVILLLAGILIGIIVLVSRFFFAVGAVLPAGHPCCMRVRDPLEKMGPVIDQGVSRAYF
jgi:hypothetical protein